MQLEKIVAFHKALADPMRVRILFLLKNGPLHGQALAGKLGVSAPTITHHMTKLRQAAIISERREKNTIYFSLDEYFFQENAKALVEALFDTKEADIQMQEEKINQNYRFERSVLTNFFSKEGRLKQIPSQRKRKLVVFERLVKDLEVGRPYPEQEINEHILRFHEDYCTIRREFIINHFMYRENNVYELNPREMWTDWRTL